jgi:hypothetical protein
MMNGNQNESVVSFLGNTSASFSLKYDDGSVQGWPLHLVATWSLSADGRNLDLLVMDADPPTRLELRGYNLGEVADALAFGSGGTATVHGVRYLALAVPERAYLVSAQVRRMQLSDE